MVGRPRLRFIFAHAHVLKEREGDLQAAQYSSDRWEREDRERKQAPTDVAPCAETPRKTARSNAQTQLVDGPRASQTNTKTHLCRDWKRNLAE